MHLNFFFLALGGRILTKPIFKSLNDRRLPKGGMGCRKKGGCGRGGGGGGWWGWERVMLKCQID